MYSDHSNLCLACNISSGWNPFSHAIIQKLIWTLHGSLEVFYCCQWLVRYFFPSPQNGVCLGCTTLFGLGFAFVNNLIHMFAVS